MNRSKKTFKEETTQLVATDVADTVSREIHADVLVNGFSFNKVKELTRRS